MPKFAQEYKGPQFNYTNFDYSMHHLAYISATSGRDKVECGVNSRASKFACSLAVIKTEK
jgi:hypothetical protein